MIEEGVNICAESKYFGTPIEAAASGGHLQMVLLLLENDFDVLTWLVPVGSTSRRSSFHKGFNATLRAASTAGHENMVRMLLDSKYESRSLQSGYRHAACDAARMGHAGIVRLLLDRIEIAMRRNLQRVILLIASENGHEAIVQWMLDLGTPANNYDDKSWVADQPIHGAAARGHDKIVKLLLAGGAKQVKGELAFPLHEAARGGFVKVAQMLIDHGADIDAWAFPATPIFSAVLSGNAQMVLFLIDKGANLGLGMSGQLALYCAARDGQETMVRLLVEWVLMRNSIHCSMPSSKGKIKWRRFW